MYISENFVYTELHKTAGTHIGKWLKILAPGKQTGKHNRIPAELRSKFIIGSIRNPWDWYVSLWGYGCDSKGSVWRQTTDNVNFRYYKQQLSSEMGYQILPPWILARQLMSDLKKSVEPWKRFYQNSSDPQCFKSWLKLIFDHEKSLDLREGFGFSPISKQAGILTYRFFKLFTSLDKKIYSKKLFLTHNNLEELWYAHKFADFFIRLEHLEDDLLQAMQKSAVQVSQQNKQELLAAKYEKTNTSSRLPAKYYYDEESIQLVYEREKFLINLFNYTAPK